MLSGVRHLRPLVAVALAASVAVAGCTRTTDGYAHREMPAIGAPIVWEECLSAKAAADPEYAGTRCGRLGVPIDYDKPDGATASIFIVKIPAKGNKIGSLIINPGGPGESGANSALSLVSRLPAEIRERFDLVGFDPRGVGRSKPTLWCNSDADNDRLRADPMVDYSPAGVTHIEDETKQFVQRCVDRMGTGFLENIGTASIVKDLDALRAALGDNKLTYLGYSYGTRIGSSYAERYPQNVRAMVLDGAIDPSADPTEADVRQAKAFQEAFNEYAAECAKSPDCALGSDPAKAVEVYHDLIDPLVTKPASTKDPRGLSYSDAIVGTILPMYAPSLWPGLNAALRGLRDGHGDKLLELADQYMQRQADGSYSNATDARAAVNCVDRPPVKDRAVAVDADRRIRQVAPFMSYGDFTGHAPLST
ncbi:MAG: hypothetical protein QOH57_5418, partial [Mycobacterium sp.]|nr:hypothetical protein [Mycobacterium sp.]